MSTPGTDIQVVDDQLSKLDTKEKETQTAVTVLDNGSEDTTSQEVGNTLPPVPLRMKLLSVLLVTCIGFGSQWSSGVTSAMKSTIKKVYNHRVFQYHHQLPRDEPSNDLLAKIQEMHINNTQFSLLEASEDFMSSALILVTGILTDRLGGTGCIVYGNIIYTIGSILIAGSAEVRSYKFMIVGRVVMAFGDIATQVAQYKVFSSWFPPSHGFASTLGFELGVKKVCCLSCVDERVVKMVLTTR